MPQMPPPPSGRPLSGRDVSHKAPAPVLQEPSFDSLLVYFKAVHPPLSVERLSGELQTLGIRQLVFKTIALPARGCINILLVDPTAETIAEFLSCWRASAALAPYPIYEYDSKAQILCHAPPLQPRLVVADFPLVLYRGLIKKIAKEDTLWNPAETLEVERFHTFCTFGAVLPCSWAPLDPGWTKKSTKHTKLKVVFTFRTLADTLNAAANFCLIPSTAEMLHCEPYVELRDFHAAGIPHREVPN